MATHKDIAWALTAFEGQYGGMVSTALETYIDYMHEEHQKALAAWEAIKDDPEKAAQQDKSLVTTHGLRMMSEMFSQAADKARRTLREWGDLREKLGDDDEEGEIRDALTGKPLTGDERLSG